MNKKLRSVLCIFLPGLIVGMMAAGVFGFLSWLDGLGDFYLFLYLAFFFSFLSVILSLFFIFYGRVFKTELSAHHQFFMFSVMILAFMVFVTASFIIKAALLQSEWQHFYEFPRILAFLMPVPIFFGLSKISRRPLKNLVMIVVFTMFCSWMVISSFGFIVVKKKATAETNKSPNILLITIESLRYDHLGYTSGNRIKSENLDNLIKKGAFFNNYYVQAPYTTTSLTTLVTGKYPFNHGARAFGQKPQPDQTLFFERLKENGYYVRIDASYIPELFESDDYLKPQILEGFFSFTHTLCAFLGDLFPDLLGAYCLTNSTSMLKTSRLNRAIRLNRGKKWFFWTHFVTNCHWPYKSPPQFTRLYDQGNGISRTEFTRDEIYRFNANPDSLTSEIRKEIDLIYSSEVSCIDKQIGFLVSRLKRMDLLENTVIIISADHGESLGEDGFVGHGKSLKDNLIHVPLIIFSENKDYNPGGKQFAHLVEEIDLAPTILDICGVEYSRDVFDGQSFVNLLNKGGWEKKWVYSERVDEEGKKFFASIRSDRYKLVWDSGQDHFSLYDLDEDPYENKDVNLRYPLIVGEMKRSMLDLSGRTEFSQLMPKVRDKLDKDMRDKMRALGYIK